MQVSLINEYKEKWKLHLHSIDTIEHAFYFEIVQNWQANWNIEGSNLSAIYDSSLQSKVSARLWGGSQNSPKAFMMLMMEKEPDFVRACFRDLFSDAKDLGLRLDRFGIQIHEVFRLMQSKNPKLVDHFHNDRKILTLYLALEYPEQYCLWDYPAFSEMMEKIGARNIPSKVEVERYYKSCRGICKLISKDEELLQLLNSKIGEQEVETGNMMVMSLFMEFVSQK